MSYTHIENKKKATKLLVRKIEAFSNVQFDHFNEKDDEFKIEIYT